MRIHPRADSVHILAPRTKHTNKSIHATKSITCIPASRRLLAGKAAAAAEEEEEEEEEEGEQQQRALRGDKAAPFGVVIKRFLFARAVNRSKARRRDVKAFLPSER